MKMILKIFLLFFFFAILENNVDALSCNQGQILSAYNLSLPPVTQCPMAAYSCILVIDLSVRMTIMWCQSTNCTMPGSYSISTTEVCQNSGYPPQTICCCYGDGCNGKMLTKMISTPPVQQISLPSNSSVCSLRGSWGTWSDWSECPNSADPIFELLSDINIQTRNRDCLPQPSGCIRSGTFMCDGQHWEQRPCGKRPVGNGTVTTNFMLSSFLTMPNGSG